MHTYTYVTYCSSEARFLCGPVVEERLPAPNSVVEPWALAAMASGQGADASSSVQMAEPEQKFEPPEDAEVLSIRKSRQRWAMYKVAISSAVYYGFGIAYYTQRGQKVMNSGPGCENPFLNETLCMAHWTVTDTIYFATVTMTTTGYGDLKPLTTETRMLTLLFMLFGLIVRDAIAASHAVL